MIDQHAPKIVAANGDASSDIIKPCSAQASSHDPNDQSTVERTGAESHLSHAPLDRDQTVAETVSSAGHVSAPPSFRTFPGKIIGLVWKAFWLDGAALPAERAKPTVDVGMPVMKREDWLKLSPREKLLHRIQRNIDHARQLQARYDRGRVSGRIADADCIVA